MAIKYYYDVEQGSDEWHLLRLGVVTASNVKKLFTATTFKPAKNDTVRKYALEIAAQRELMRVEDSFQSFQMLRGTMQEEVARDIYNDNFIESTECGFITREFDGVTVGVSPDGLVNADGGIEIKSRLSKFQFDTILSDEVPSDFLLQCQTFLLVTGRKWIDFVSYSNELPLFVKKVLPDLELHEKIISTVIAFDLEVENIRAEYKEKSRVLVPTPYVDWQADDFIEGSE